MRTKEINKWVQEGGPLPQDLTQEEKEHLAKLGWAIDAALYNDGQKWWEEHYLHGKEHGKHENWWDNGQKSYEANYLHGKHHGKWEGWYEDGQKYEEQNWIYGVEHGVFTEWDKDGNLVKDEEYYYGNKIK